MKFDFKYGKGKKILDISGDIERITPGGLLKKNSLGGFKGSLAQRIEKENLAGKKIAIVVSDKSRRCHYPVLLQAIIEVLSEKGAIEEHITFYIAYGTHAAQGNDESIETYGDIFSKYKFIHHSSTCRGTFINLGKTTFGTEVKVRRDVIESDLIIAVGAISFHYFAGFGGGRKLLFPGLAAKEPILHNHRLFLDAEKKQLHKKCQPGNLKGNPIADDLKEIAEMLPGRIEVHGLLNEKGDLIDVLFGDDYSDFEQACKIHIENFQMPSAIKYDAVIASAGGYPKDINFIQVHKSIHHASLFTKEGGKIIVIAECRDSIGSDSFLEHFRYPYSEAFDKIYHNYSGNGGTALSLMEKTRKFEVYLYTSLSEALCKQIGIKKLATVSEVEKLTTASESVLVMENPTYFISGF